MKDVIKGNVSKKEASEAVSAAKLRKTCLAVGWGREIKCDSRIAVLSLSRRFVPVAAQTSSPLPRDFKHCLRFFQVGSSRQLKQRILQLIYHHHVPLSHHRSLLYVLFTSTNLFHDVCTFFHHFLSRSHPALASPQPSRSGSSPTGSSRKHYEHVQRC